MKTKKRNNDILKQSLLIGALTSSFGIFISKLLGLFYYSPLSEMAGEANMAFYSIVYTYYDLLLQISQAGIPFAIASLIARYVAKKDYKTVLLVKKMGTSIILALSLFISIIFIMSSGLLARQSLGAFAPASDLNNLKKLFAMLTIAIIIVPLLSALRGYAQGLKRLDLYASSQVLEQFVRVAVIIFVGYLFVVILKFESIWAIFIAVLAASVGALFAYLYTKFFIREDNRFIVEEASKQSFDNNYTKVAICKEILVIGLPYLLISFLGSAGPLINTVFFLDYMTKVNGPQIYESAILSSGILQANIAKLSNIPSVLAIGFGSGIVPYLSESLEENNNRKITSQINQILDTTTFILVPMIMVFIFFAKDIYFIMYGNNNLQLGADLFRVSNIQIFLGTLAPIFSSIMVSLKLRKESIVTLIVSFIIKLVSFFPLVKYFGTYGMIYSSGVYYLLQILVYFYYLRINFNINVRGASKRFVLIVLASLIMVVPAYVIYRLLPISFDSRLTEVLIMLLLGVLMLVNYYFVSIKLGLPQKIFDLKEVSIKKLLAKYRG